jgi:hypothetical protein
MRKNRRKTLEEIIRVVPCQPAFHFPSLAARSTAGRKHFEVRSFRNRLRPEALSSKRAAKKVLLK